MEQPADKIPAIAQRHGFSAEAGQAAYAALRRGTGGLAQFDHPDLGGMGQWSRGGMIMVGDMFNHALKARVAALCDELSVLIADHPAQDTASCPSRPSGNTEPARPDDWWPEALGVPSAVGAQNDTSYAYFADKRRLAVSRQGEISVYDTGDHRISGFSQQNSGAPHSFVSQRGSVSLDDLQQV